MHSLASPAKFIRIADRVLPWLVGATVLLLAFGLAEALFISPPDYQQGDSVRIMYIHVPSAWMAMMIYSVIAAASASFLIWRHPLADIIARQSALPGAVFAGLTLVTGSLWGKPMWGAWWVWDARLTSVLVLFFMYIGYIALSDAYAGRERGKKACAILALAGFINIPVIHFSVQWWNTLHQPSSFLRQGGISIAPTMLVPLLSMWLAFNCFYLVVLILRVRTALNEQKIRRIMFSS